MLPFAAPPTTRPSDATAHELELLKLRGLRQQTENLLRAAPYTAAAAEPHAALGTHAGLLAPIELPPLTITDASADAKPPPSAGANAEAQIEASEAADADAQAKCFAACQDGRRQRRGAD